MNEKKVVRNLKGYETQRPVLKQIDGQSLIEALGIQTVYVQRLEWTLHETQASLTDALATCKDFAEE